MTRTIRRTLLSTTAVMGGGRLLVAALGLAATPLFTRVLSPAAYGAFALSLAITAIASTVPTQWLLAATLRFAPASGAGHSRNLVVVGSAICLGPVVAVAVGISIPTLRFDPALVWLTTAYAACEAIFVAFWVLSRALLHPWSFVVGGVLRNLVSVLIVFVATLSVHQVGVQFVLVAMIIASLTGSLSMVVFSLGFASGTTAENLTSWFHYGWPMILNYGLGLALAYGNRFMILALSGPAAVGLFSPTYDLMFSIITLTTSLVGLTAVPRLFAESDGGVQQRMLRALHRRVIVTSLGVAGAMIALWPWLSRVLIGDQLRVNDWLFVSVLGASFALLAYRFQYLNVRVQLDRRSKMQMFATGVGLIINVVLNFLLIPHSGINGAALATLAGAGTAAAVLMVERYLRARMGDR